jgi:uncharacterized protein (DUF779 family)
MRMDIDDVNFHACAPVYECWSHTTLLVRLIQREGDRRVQGMIRLVMMIWAAKQAERMAKEALGAKGL